MLAWTDLGHTGIETLCADGDVLYGVQSGRVFRSTDLGVTLELGATIDIAYGGVSNIFKTGTGFVITTRKTTTDLEEGSILHLDTWDDASPTLVLTTTSNGAWFDALSCSSFYDGTLDLVFCAEYGRRGTAKKKLWVSKDGGLSFRDAWSTLNGDTTVNSHWHCVEWDRYDEVLWAASGDGQTNSKLWLSEDIGVSWRFSPDARQPTCIVPLPERIVFGIDESWLSTGAYEEQRADVPCTFGAFTETFVLDAALSGPHQYAEPAAISGSTAYIPFNRQIGTGPHIIYATTDGGATWARVYEDADHTVNALTMLGSSYLFAYRTGRQLSRASR